MTAGNEFTCFETPWTNIGIGICYDIRFADLAQIYTRENNCGLLIYPGAFNMTTGNLHICLFLFEWTPSLNEGKWVSLQGFSLTSGVGIGNTPTRSTCQFYPNNT